MNIQEATSHYEQWLGEHIDLIQSDITRKHQQMALAVFPFLRASYYRWAQTWQDACPELTDAPVVLSVGDLHIENFGTWRRQGKPTSISWQNCVAMTRSGPL